MKDFIIDDYEVIVIGAGHAGCEAGLASARLGKKTLLLTISMDSVADLPCNPNIGGTGKGHLVREIDALGGEMGINIDKTFIQSRMLNTSKGPAIHSLRVQADKVAYHIEMKKTLESTDNLTLMQDEAVELIIEDNKFKGIKTRTNTTYLADALIIATGTYLKSEVLIGEVRFSSGPLGKTSAEHFSDSLRKYGIDLMRFKTGSPARIHADYVNYEGMEILAGDDEIVPFSFMNEGKDISKKQENCYLTYSTLETQRIIEENLSRSPMYSGEAHGIGPRYCPSLEDKIVRFSDRDRHQIFLEPESLTTKELYVQGASSTLPYDVQVEMYKSIIGLEDVKIMRPAYGIEYDVIDSTTLKRTLEHKEIDNLFFAGQINGSSGYEEAASQGLIAGINAVLNIDGKEPFILDRSDGYIGVLVDDLVTKGTKEPYRMMTSRAEYRLLLRQDNADIRLTQKGRDLGLVDDERYEIFTRKVSLLEKELSRLKEVKVNPSVENNKVIVELGSNELKTTIPLYDLIKRPELDYDKVSLFDENRETLPKEVKNQIEIMIKYEGYIEKQKAQIKQFKKVEEKDLTWIKDYKEVANISNEAVQKLNDIKPETIGQASRISGVSPADINNILIYIEVSKRNAK